MLQRTLLILPLVILLAASPSLAIETLPVSEIKPGMIGVGRTVFQGTEIEEFGIEIISVIPNARPHGDLILFRGHGDVLEHAGIIQGMSGSPVYIEGKLIGAVSFAYPGAKDPIGAITPIEEMLELLTEDLGDANAGEGSGGGEDPETGDRASRSFSWGNEDIFSTAWTRFRQPARGWHSAFSTGETIYGPSRTSSLLPLPSMPPEPDGDAMRALSTPICLSGWSDVVQSEMSDVFARFGFEPVGVSGSGKPMEMNPIPLEPGSAVGVQMIDGDADVVAIGTVTHVDGDRMIAFGHPMIQSGDVAFPMSGAYIHTVLANNVVSMKMGSSTGLLGGVWNDRRSGIAGVSGSVPERLPVTVSVQTDRGEKQTYGYGLARHAMLTPFFLPWTVTNSYLTSGWVTGDAFIETDVEVFFDEGRSVRRRDRTAAEAPGTAVGADVTLPAALLLINPWEEARIDSMHVELRYEKGNSGAIVEHVACSHRRARPGDIVTIDVAIRPFRGDVVTRSFDFRVADAWAGQSLRINVGANADFVAWDQDRAPEKFVPQNFEQMIEMIERMPDDSFMTLRIYTDNPGTLLQGVELPALPASLASAVLGGASTKGFQQISGSLLMEEQKETPWVLAGGETVYVEVATQ